MKKLKTLLEGLDNYKIIGDINVSITSIHFNSNESQSSSLFVAISGRQKDKLHFLYKLRADGDTPFLAHSLIDSKSPSFFTTILLLLFRLKFINQ